MARLSHKKAQKPQRKTKHKLKIDNVSKMFMIKTYPLCLFIFLKGKCLIFLIYRILKTIFKGLKWLVLWKTPSLYHKDSQPLPHYISQYPLLEFTGLKQYPTSFFLKNTTNNSSKYYTFYPNTTLFHLNTTLLTPHHP